MYVHAYVNVYMCAYMCNVCMRRACACVSVCVCVCVHMDEYVDIQKSETYPDPHLCGLVGAGQRLGGFRAVLTVRSQSGHSQVTVRSTVRSQSGHVFYGHIAIFH